MTPADFHSEYGSTTVSNTAKRPTLLVVGQDHPASAQAGDAGANHSAARPQSGFLNQSLDEIARLYVESPFSW